MKKIVLTALLVGVAGGACAQAYMGATVGFARTQVACGGTTACAPSDKGAKLYLGYAYSPLLAAEVGFVDFGDANLQRPSQGFNVSTNVGTSALTAGLALRMDLAPAWGGVVRAGVAHVRTAVDEVAAGSSYASRVSKANRAYGGVALEYSFAKQAKAVLSADFTQARFEGTQGMVQLLGLGVQYAF